MINCSYILGWHRDLWAEFFMAVTILHNNKKNEGGYIYVLFVVYVWLTQPKGGEET